MTRALPAGAGTSRHLRVVDAQTAQAAEDRAVEAARELALSLLTARARTRSELATALARRGIDEAVATEVLDRLTRVGLLDDAAYARAYAEHEAGRKGPRAVADALRRRGVPPAVARQAAFAADPDDVRAAAVVLATAALPRWHGLPAHVAHRRLAGLLTRRGYDHGLVHAVVRDLLGELPQGTARAED